MAKTDSAKMTSTAEERLIALSALLNFGRIINIKEKDVQNLYEKIEKINELQTEEDLQASLEYEQILGSDLDKIKSVEDLRQRIQEQKSKLGTRLFEQYGTDKIRSAVYDVLRATAYGNGKEAKRQTNINEKTAQGFAEIIEQKKLDEIFVPVKGEADNTQTYADKLAEIVAINNTALIERMGYDFESYKKRVKNPVVEEVIPDINYFLVQPHECKFNFITHKNIYDSDPINVAMEKEKFNANKDMRRKDIRGPFSAKARPNFVRLMATMQEIGFEHCDNNLKSMNETDINKSFAKIEKIIEEIYGNDKEKVLQGMFGKDYEQRKTQAVESCIDLYGKLYTACLSEKITKEWTAKGNYIKGLSKNAAKDFTRNVSDFISNALTEGKLNPFKMFECPIEETKGDETNLTASVHHNFTVGAIEDACGKMGRYGVKDTSIEACSDTVNNLGLFTEIIGKEVHGSLEPSGEIVLSAKKNNSFPKNMIFAGSAKGITPTVLEGLGYDKNSQLYKMIMQNVKNQDKNGRIFAHMKLPEGKVIENIREECENIDKQKTSRTISDLFKITTGKGKNC